MDKYIHITESSIEVNGIDSTDDAISLLLSSVLHVMEKPMQIEAVQADEGLAKQLRQHIYDTMNVAFSNVLDKFMPDAVDETDQFSIEDYMAWQDKQFAEAESELKESNPRLYRRRKKDLEQRMSDLRARIIELQQRNEKSAT